MITILLDQNAIEEALTNYIGETTLGVDLSSKEVSIKLTAGRGDNGMRAEVNISPREESANESENDAEESPLPAADEVPSAADEPAVVSPFD